MKAIIIAVCAALLLGGCAGGTKLSDKFDADKVKKDAEEVVDMVNAEEYEKLVDEKWAPGMKSALDAEKMADGIKPVIDDLGAFESFDKEAVTGSVDKDTDQEFAVAVIKVKYEKRNAQFTISYDEDMRVAGFYLK